eukprot:284314_1
MRVRFAVFKSKKSNKPISNIVQCVLPNLYESNLSMQQKTASQSISAMNIQLVKNENNDIHIYVTHPLKMNIFGYIQYQINYFNSDGIEIESTNINALPFQIPNKNSISFSITALIINNDMKYKMTQPSDVFDILLDGSHQLEQSEQLQCMEDTKEEYNNRQTQKPEEDTNERKVEINPQFSHTTDTSLDMAHLPQGYDDKKGCHMIINDLLKLCGIVKANNIDLSSDKCVIEGSIESNTLLLTINKKVELQGNNYFIQTLNGMKFNSMKELLFSNTDTISIRPQSNDETLSMISMSTSECKFKKCKIESKGECKISNTTNLIVKASIINTEKIEFDTIDCFEFVDKSQMTCADLIKIDNTKQFKLHDSYLSVQNSSCIIKLDNLFFMDNLSTIHCAYQYVNIVCEGKIELHGKITIDECCKFKIHAQEQIVVDNRCEISSKSIFKPDIEHDINLIVKEYLQQPFNQNNVISNSYYLHFNSSKSIQFKGTVIGKDAFCIIDSKEYIGILGNATFKLLNLYVKCDNNIDFDGRFEDGNGNCHLCAMNTIDIQNNSYLTCCNAFIDTKENVCLNGIINCQQVDIKSRQCDINECKIDSFQTNIIVNQALSCLNTSITSHKISITCKQNCEMMDNVNIICKAQIDLNSESFIVKNSRIKDDESGKVKMDFNVSKDLTFSNVLLESHHLLIIRNTNNAKIIATKMDLSQIYVNNVNTIQFINQSEVKYLNKFRVETVDNFVMENGVVISVNKSSHNFDSDMANEFVIKANNMTVNSTAEINCYSQKIEVDCTDTLNVDGIITIKESCIAKFTASTMNIRENGKILSHLTAVKQEKVALIKSKEFISQNLVQDIHRDLCDEFYLHIYCTKGLNLYGNIISPKGLTLIDCMETITIYRSSNLNTGTLFIRSMGNINFNGKIYNEIGECFIGANNTLHLQNDGDICLLFLKYWANYLIPDCDQITADNLTLEQLEETLKKIDDKINNFDKYKKDKLMNIQQQLTEIEKKHKFFAKEVSDTIDKTGLSESNIALFLNKLNKLLDVTMKQQEHLNSLSTKLDTFITLIQREFSAELTIDSYFEFQNLTKCVQYLKDKGIMKLYQLECTDEKEFESRVLPICAAIKGFNNRDKRELKKICCQSELWKMYQNEKTEMVTKSLQQIAPNLADFFGSINDEMGKIQNATKLQLEPKQNKSITIGLNNNKSKKLNEIAKKSLDVIIQCKKKSNKKMKEGHVLQLKAKTVINGISDSCEEIIRNQQEITDSIILSNSILAMKPNELKTDEKETFQQKVVSQVQNAVVKAWKPYTRQRTNRKHIQRKAKNKVPQDIQTVIIENNDEFNLLCYIQMESIMQAIGYNRDDEIINIRINFNQKPSKRATYYILQCNKIGKGYLGKFEVKTNKIVYTTNIDLIDFVEDSDTETDDDGKTNGIDHIFAIYKDKLGRNIISNSIQISLPEIDEYEPKLPPIPYTVLLATVKAVYNEVGSIDVYWKYPSKINVFGSLKYEINYKKLNNSEQKSEIIETLPWCIPSDMIPISFQITTCIIKNDNIYRSIPTKKIIITDKQIEKNNSEAKPVLNNEICLKSKEEKMPEIICEEIPSIVDIPFVYKFAPEMLKSQNLYKPSLSCGIYGSYLYTVSKEILVKFQNEECLNLLYNHLIAQNKKQMV